MANDTKEEFWGVTLSKQTKEYVWDPSADSEADVEHKLQLSTACLGSKAKKDERNLVEVSTEDDLGETISLPIVSLRVGGSECVHIDLGFHNKTTFTLKEGNGPLSLSGMHLQALPLDFEEEDDDEESDDEDIPDLVPAPKVAATKEDKVEAKKQASPVKRPAPAKDEKPAKKKKIEIIESEDEDDVDEEEGSEDDDESGDEDAENSLLDNEAGEGTDEESEEDDEPEDGDDVDTDDDDEEMEEGESDDDDGESEDDEEEEEETPVKKQNKKTDKKLTNGHATPSNKNQKKKEDNKNTPAAKTPTAKDKKTPAAKDNKKTPAAKDTPGKGGPKKTPEELKVLLLKSPNLPKKFDKFTNFMKNNYKLTDEQAQKDMWDYIQKNKK